MSALSSLIQNAKAGRFGENWQGKGETAAAELAALRNDLSTAKELLTAWIMAEDLMNEIHGHPDDTPSEGSVHAETVKFLERQS